MSKSFQLKLRQIQGQLPLVLQRIPGVIKVEGLQFIKDNFQHEGFENKPGQYEKWKNKKTKGARKKTLVGEKRGGKLKRTWKGSAQGTQAEFSNALPYAEVHNEGLKAGKPPGFTMPQRQMIGDSDALNNRVENKLDKMINGVFM